MQNLSQDEQRALSDQVNLINNRTATSEMSRAVTIGLLLSGFVGMQVLQHAVQSIKDRPPSPMPAAVDSDAIKRDLAADRDTFAREG